MTNDARTNWRERGAWVALFLVFTPVLIDLARHVATNSWAVYALAFPPLALVVVHATPRSGSHVVPALFAVVLGMGIEAIALASGTLRLGRIGFVVCVAAVLLLEGRFRMRTAVLLGLCVPLPHWILERTAAGFLYPIADALAAMDRASGTPALALGASVERVSGVMLLEAVDAGLTAGVLGFGLAWFAFTRRHASFAETLGLSFMMAVLGVGVHLVATLLTFHVGSGAELDSLRWIRDAVAYGGVAVVVAGLFRLPMLWTRPAKPT